MEERWTREKEQSVFTINGKLYQVGDEVAPTTSLNTFIRDHALLPGTKIMCGQGVCGSCVVNVRYKENKSGKVISRAVNSCLLPVLACHGYAITTVEGIGSRSKGYHKVQTTLANFNGTQCGFCSPGFVMSMYSLLDAHPSATAAEVEDNFSGNICRCTGYRPILDAFKSLSSNPPAELSRRLAEIEESHLFCPKRTNGCGPDSKQDPCGGCMRTSDEDCFELDFSELSLSKDDLKITGPDSDWYRPTSVKEIFEIFDRIGNRSYMLVAGNTSRGVEKFEKEPDVLIDMNSVNQLKHFVASSSAMIFGSMTRQTDMIRTLKSMAKKEPNSFGYGQPMAEHLSLVATVPVRNRATVGGNLALLKYWKNFPSDIYLLLDAVGATLVIASLSGITRTMSLAEFINSDLHHKIITKIILPSVNKTTRLLSYKVMPVSQSALALVNAAFLYDIDVNGNLKGSPSLCFSAISPNFRHAYQTESYLRGKNLFNADVLKRAVNSLWNEIKPDDLTVRYSKEYRKLVATALFYRSVLSLAGDRADLRMRSGGQNLIRPLSSGKQVYQHDEKEYPLTQPIPKLEAQIQCAGEATFVNDFQKQKNELSAHFVLAKQYADIEHVDPSKALRMKGVVAYYSAKDIPGENNVCFPFIDYFVGKTELFSTGTIHFCGQPIGLIVAETHDIAETAASLVEIVYKKPKTPLIHIKDVLSSSERSSRVVLRQSQKAKEPGVGGTLDVEGEVAINATGQYAHSIETPICHVSPAEDGQFNVCVATQTTTVTKGSIAKVMGIPMNKIDCVVPRLGGSFGSKNTTQLYGACACTLAASKLQRPVRMAMTVSADMNSLGKRGPFYTTYKGKCDQEGRIQGMEIDVYVDYGYVKIMEVYVAILPCLQNYFNSSTWNINIYDVYTDKTPMLILRAPGFMEAISTIEQIMDHVAFLTSRDPIDVRITNSVDSIMTQYIQDWRKQTDFDSRKQQINQFNTENRWKKKGISMTGCVYPFSYAGSRLGCTVGILYPDGTIQIQHGGIEMGQGINTKVAQVVAFELNRPLNTIQVKPNSSINSPNHTPTWGSIGSELVVYAAIECCRQLNSGLDPLKQSMKDPTWQELVVKAFNDRVPLSAYVPLGKFPPSPYGEYAVHGVCVTETELDVLTGQHQITRVDILEDVGKSMSPEVDVGQIEGGFIMSLGLFTSEELIYDKKTGRLLTDNLLAYHAPRSKDIPVDFRVTFVPNALNPNGVLNSKATGEPSVSFGVSILNSIREGLLSARSDAGLQKTWVKLDAPCTPQVVLMNSGTTKEQFVLQKE